MTSSTLGATSAESSSLDLPCPVCGEVKIAGESRAVFDDRHGHPGLFYLVACSTCGHVMTNPRLRESELAALYGQYYPRKLHISSDVSRQGQSASGRWAGFVRWLLGTDNQGQYRARRGDRMLDVGCGSGVSLIEATALGAETYGIEADPNVQRIAADLGLRIHQGSLHDQPFPGIDFDLVVLNQVIEHIPEPDRALVSLRKRLAQSGRIVLVFPNRRSLWCRISGTRWINWHVPYHLHHFDAESFRRMARRCGYDVAGMRSITPNLWTLLQLRALRMRPARGVPGAMWQASVPAAATPESVRSRRSPKTVVFVTALTLLALVNRLVDALGAGDSLMVELKPAGAP